MATNNSKKIWHSLAFKMILLIFLAIAAIMVLILAYNYNVTKKIVVTNLKSEANKITENTVLKIDKVLSNIQAIPMNYSPLIVSEPPWLLNPITNRPSTNTIHFIIAKTMGS